MLCRGWVINAVALRRFHWKPYETSARKFGYGECEKQTGAHIVASTKFGASGGLNAKHLRDGGGYVGRTSCVRLDSKEVAC